MHSHSPIDIHAHFYPPEYLRTLARDGHRYGGAFKTDAEGFTVTGGPISMGPLPQKFTDVDLRVAEMDEIGVEIHALSLTGPMVDFADGEDALALAAAFNDGCAAAHEKYPDRLFGLAALPWHEPALAVKELERAAALPGIRGVYSMTRVRDAGARRRGISAGLRGDRRARPAALPAPGACRRPEAARPLLPHQPAGQPDRIGDRGGTSDLLRRARPLSDPRCLPAACGRRLPLCRRPPAARPRGALRRWRIATATPGRWNTSGASTTTPSAIRRRRSPISSTWWAPTG